MHRIIKMAKDNTGVIGMRLTTKANNNDSSVIWRIKFKFYSKRCSLIMQGDINYYHFIFRDNAALRYALSIDILTRACRR